MYKEHEGFWRKHDLTVDPGETNNLYYEQPDIAMRMKADLDRLVESGRSAPRN